MGLELANNPRVRFWNPAVNPTLYLANARIVPRSFNRPSYLSLEQVFTCDVRAIQHITTSTVLTI